VAQGVPNAICAGWHCFFYRVAPSGPRRCYQQNRDTDWHHAANLDARMEQKP